MYIKEFAQTGSYSNQAPGVPDACPRSPVEIELDRTNDLIDNVGHGLERLEQALRLVLAPQPPQAVGNDLAGKKQSECDLQGRLISTNTKLETMASRLENIISRVRV